MRPLIAIPATLALVVRAYTRKSLTISGILAATLTATIHALHPSPIPFTLLVVFFLLGTTATKVKHNVKANLTISSTGSSGGEGPRTTIQVLANSGVASVLVLVYLWLHDSNLRTGNGCFGGQDKVKDIILLGIIANYAATTADTLSSELGILSKSKPRLITAPWRVVPPGTNGGVSLTGLVGGMGGSFVIGVVTVALLTFCKSDPIHITMIGHRPEQLWPWRSKLPLILVITFWGTMGSVLDSILGAVLQASVVDSRTGKIVEGAGGSKVLVASTNKKSRVINSGNDILDNNQINLLMALLMSLSGMAIGSIAWLSKSS